MKQTYGLSLYFIDLDPGCATVLWNCQGRSIHLDPSKEMMLLLPGIHGYDTDNVEDIQVA
jgi:hypothetical protein